MSLFWRLVMADAAVMALTLLLLSVTPITIDTPILLDQFVILLAALAAVFTIQLLVLKRVLSPLRRLTDLMGTIDPDRPGRRLTDVSGRGAEVVELADAFNRMLDRLERERRESARVALSAQESERARLARELHAEIGQTLTAVAIEAERAADDPSGEALRDVAAHVRTSLDDVRRIVGRPAWISPAGACPVPGDARSIAVPGARGGPRAATCDGDGAARRDGEFYPYLGGQLRDTMET